MYRGYGITFDSAGFWSFDNDSARNVIIFGADKGSSSHPDNRNNNFLILGQDPYQYPESFMLFKKVLYNDLNLELNTPFDSQLRT